MSRSGYSYDYEDLWLWHGAVASAIRGKRGQAFLRELLAALDALPVKELIAEDFEHYGGFCALGAVARQRGMDLDELNKLYEDESKLIAHQFGIAHALACEIMYENDEAVEYWKYETPEDRYARVRRWVESQLIGPA
jgi:hypothetical protein